MSARAPVSTADDVAQLRARVDELEAELARRQRVSSRSRISEERRLRPESRFERSRKESVERLRDTSMQAMDEGSKLVRGLSLAYLEQLRAIADALNLFVDTVNERNSPESNTSLRGLSSQLPTDISNAFVDAIDVALDAPARMADRLYENYQETEEVERSTASVIRMTRPADSSTGKAPASVMVAFNRDVSTARPDLTGTITVEKDKLPVDGIVSRVDSRTLLWTPNDVLTNGIYTVTVSGLESDRPRGRQSMLDPYVFGFVVSQPSA